MLYPLHRSENLTKKLNKSLIDIIYLKMEIIFMNSKNSKTSEIHRLKLNLTEKLKKNLRKTWLQLIWVFITIGKT